MSDVIFVLVLFVLLVMAFTYLVYVIMRGAKDFNEDIEFNPGKEEDHAHDSID